MDTAQERRYMQYFGYAVVLAGFIWIFNLSDLCTDLECISHFWAAAFVIVLGCITLFIAIFEEDDEFLMHKFWLGILLPALTTLFYILITPVIYPGVIVAVALIYYGIQYEDTPELTLGGFLGILFTLLFLQF